MIRRTTIWSEPDGTPLQVSICILDDVWEPLVEVTEMVSAHSSGMEARRAAEDRVASWLMTMGVQGSLPI